MRRLSLKWRIVLPVGVMLIIGVGVMVTIIALRFTSAVTEGENRNLEALSQQYANRVTAELELSLGGVKSLAAVLGTAAGTPRADRNYYTAIMSQIVTENRSLFGVWSVFEPDAFDGRDKEFVNGGSFTDATGRYIPNVYLAADGKTTLEPLADYNTPGLGDYYLTAKNSNQEALIPPYNYQAGGTDYYVATVSVPIHKEGRLIGVAGGDLRMDPICDLLKSVRLYEHGFLMLITQEGSIAYHPNRANWTRDAREVLSPLAYATFQDTLRDGQTRNYVDTSTSTGKHVMVSMSTLTVGDSGDTWVILAAAPSEEVLAGVYSGLALIISVGVIVLLAALAIAYILVNNVSKVLVDISGGIFTASSSVNEASTGISSASESLAEGATEQAASLEETSSALEQMASMTRQNADNTIKTNESTKNTARLIGEGAEAVRNMSSAMTEISESSEKISRIIKTIEDIAFQTNLLALNAAVEAARAGESGKGFAVVADEVRNLAGRSAQAARDTTELIQGTVERVRNGSAIAADLDRSFRGIEEGSAVVSRLITEITSATNEQAQGVDQVNTAVAQMDKVTQQNAANAEETASITRTLSEQAEQMDEMVQDLSRLVTGEKMKRKAAPSRPAVRPSQPQNRRLLAHSGKF